KRVNFSARTVISPDPVLSINEVGVPVEAARELTVPIHVQSYNHDIVKEWVKRGPTPAAPVGEFYIPGVNYVIRSDGRRIRVTEHILSPRFGVPVIGGIHDHITGAFLLTYKDAKFSKEETAYILSKIGIRDLPPPGVKKGGLEYWTGKQVFSMILPKDLSLTFKSSIAPKGEHSLRELREEDALVVIKNGEVSSGTIDENAVGAFKGKILDKIARDYGPDAAREFIDKATKLAIGAIMVRGFTTGIDDEDIPEEAKKQIADVLKKAVADVEALVEAYKRG